jgi:CHASE3 domain sensor protein
MAEESLWETRLIRVVTDLGTDLADLIEKELRLARTEIVQKLTLGLQAAAWFAVAAVLLGIFAVLLILEALVFGIAAAGVPLWGSCLLVAFLLCVLAAIAFLYARRQSSEDMTPVRSARQFTRAVGTVKEQLR